MARPTQQEIDEWNARMNEPDPDEDFEIEIFTPEGHGARLPYSRGKRYLADHFGIDVGDPPQQQQQNTNPQNINPQNTGGRRNSGKQTNTTGGNSDNVIEGEFADQSGNRPTQRYFGRRTT